MPTITFYYPEGPLGPTCDIVIDDDADDSGITGDGDDDGLGYVDTYPELDLPDFDRITEGKTPYISLRRCRERVLADGTIEYYDCIDTLIGDLAPPAEYPLIEPSYDWPTFTASPWGLSDNFVGFKPTPFSCNPHDPDINIIPTKFFKANGDFVLKVPVERSSPVTFPVHAITGLDIIGGTVSAEFFEIGGGLTAYFLPDGTGIQVDGTGTYTITLDFEWDDNPNTSGQSIGPMTIGGQTFNNEEGVQTRSFSVTGGNSYLWNISGQIEDSGFIISDDGQTIRWDDDAIGVFGLNFTLRIKSLIGSGNIVLRAAGTGSGQVGLKFEWDDKPSTYGQALGTVQVAGQTFTQTSGKERGKQYAIVELTSGTDYPVTITGGSGFGGNSVIGRNICFYDLDGKDCNANLSISNEGIAPATIKNRSAWSEEANKYAVWVNPMVCTLPCLEQTVTYFVDLPSTEQYTITGGADDVFQVFLNNETVPVIGGVGGIFNQEHEIVHTGSYTPPYSATRTLQEGTLKIVVKCTNGNAAGGGSTTHMRFTKNTILRRVDGSDTVGDFGSQNSFDTNYYFSPIARAVAEEYISGRFGRGGSYANRGRPPEPDGMNTHVQYYLDNGGALTDDPVDPTIWAATKTNSIVVGYTTGGQDAFGRGTSEVDLPDVDQVYYPSCNLNEPNGLGTTTNENAYKWSLNPGGWYIKICRGSSCLPPTSIPWVKSGPHKSWGNFLDTYAVYPSSTDVLVQTIHTANWNVNIPFEGSYDLEYSGDDDITISLDGTQVVTSGYIGPTSNTYTINNLSAGSHLITGTVYNASPPGAFWTQNPGGIGWTLTPANSISNVSVSFDNSGNLVTTGEGTVQVQLDFEWDDKPSQYSTALGRVKWALTGLEFTQTQGVEEGSDSSTATLNGNTTYGIQIFNNTGGFSVQNNGQKICFRDNDGNDCNAQVNINTITQGGGAIIASSLDLVVPSDGNLFWHTRKETGYKYVEIDS